MSMLTFSFIFFAILLVFPYSLPLQYSSAQTLQSRPHQLRRKLGAASPCNTGNLIDDCWACDPLWDQNRKWLAECATGFGRNAAGGKDGEIYVVTSDADDDVINPKPGTLRYAVLRDEPLWITFAESMTIVLKEELIVTSFKTIDGRGVDAVITGNSGITVQCVRHVIIHGVTVHGMKPSGNTDVRSSQSHYGFRGVSDGDGISVFESSDVWLDHCTMYSCADGLVDVVEGSTDVTVSNCHFFDHNEVMLLGHNDMYVDDKDMRVTVVYNLFGEGLTQRLPRCRFGRFEVINNYYKNGWGIYAIGGSANPTIISRGNVFVAPDDRNKKEVTYHENEKPQVWKHYDWSTEGDLMLNGAFFTSSGTSNVGELSMPVKSYEHVQWMTANAGALKSNQ